MREVTYRLALAPESAAVSTTKFMMKPAAGIPLNLKTVTNGLSATPARFHGITPTITAMAPTQMKASMAKALRVARATSALDRASPDEMATISLPRKLLKLNPIAI